MIYILKIELNLTEIKNMKYLNQDLDSCRAMLIKECFQDIYKAPSYEKFDNLLKR